MNSEQLHVLVAGGGVAGLEAIIALNALAGDRLRVTLLDPEEEFLYRPTSVVEPFAGPSSERLRFRRLETEFGITHRRGTLARVRAGERVAVTGDGEEIGYDVLIATVGARRRPALDRVTTFRGPEDSELVRGIVQDIEGGYSKRIAFVVPGGVTWPLPLYELALMTARRAREMGEDVSLAIYTPESTPLEALGGEASAAVAELLEAAGIELRTDSFADVEQPNSIRLRPSGDEIAVERIVALPVMEGPAVTGIPADERGFIPTDSDGRVPGVEDVYAAGDGTQHPVKQGGLATQQADVVAAAVARRVGVQVEASGRPVLRVKLLTGTTDRYLTGTGDSSAASEQPLWWPPGKVAGAYLAPYLAGPDAAPPPPDREGLEIELPLETPGRAG